MTGVSTLGQALAHIERIKDQQSLFSTLSTQLASGKKTNEFSEMGSDVLTSKRVRSDFNALDIYINNIDQSDRRINLMLNAVEEFKAQAEIFSNALVGFNQESVHQTGDIIYYDDPATPNVNENDQVGMTAAGQDVSFKTLTSLANDLYGFMVDLMNVQDGDRYLLGGAETLVQPLTDNGTMDAAMSTLISGWKNGTITTADLVSDLRDRTATAGNPNAITDTIIGYSASLSAGNAGDVFVQVDDDSQVKYTGLANDDAFRNILVAISYMKNENLPPIADTYIPPNTYPGVPDEQGAPGATMDEMKDNFFEVFNEMGRMVSESLKEIDRVRFTLENARARIDTIKQSHQQQQHMFKGIIADVEDVDINEVALSINTLQTQLEASFRVTALVQNLSLVNYI